MDNVPSDPADFADPGKVLTLPFLFPLEVPQDRFAVEDQHFKYFGREEFSRLYKAVSGLQFFGWRLFYLHGTLGAGKSHMLAALVCLLRKQGKKVVYLPDCRAMLRIPFEYTRMALLMALHDDARSVETLRTKCNDLSDLASFSKMISYQERLYFIIDQLNALDPQPESTDRNDSAKKAEVRNFLDEISAFHLRITSSSGNYQHGVHDKARSTGEKWMAQYGGLSDVSLFHSATCPVAHELPPANLSIA